MIPSHSQVQAGLEEGDIVDGNGGTDTINPNYDAAVTVTIDADDITDVEIVKSGLVTRCQHLVVQMLLLSLMITMLLELLDPAMTFDFSATTAS